MWEVYRTTIELRDLQSRDPRTGQTQITITAQRVGKGSGQYVKGNLFAEGMQSDVKEFELRIWE